MADEGRFTVELVDADESNEAKDYIRQTQPRHVRYVALHQQSRRSERMLGAVISESVGCGTLIGWISDMNVQGT